MSHGNKRSKSGRNQTRQSTPLDALLPAFEEVTALAEPQAARSLDQILDAHCNLIVELGRMQVSIGEVLKLGLGSVLELDRLVSDPVDLVIQGVKIARAEVVVVNDHFAVCIKEIVDSK